MKNKLNEIKLKAANLINNTEDELNNQICQLKTRIKKEGTNDIIVD